MEQNQPSETEPQSIQQNEAARTGIKIEGDGITFFSLIDFGLFLREYELFNKVKLTEPIVDNAGNILFKEDLYLKESVYNKLEDMLGHFPEKFKVSITNELIKTLRLWMAKRILDRLEDPQNKFIAELFEQTQHRYREYVKNALAGSRALVLNFFKISKEKRNFFYHLADLALLTLGVIIQKTYNIKYINRNAFIAGFCVDLPFGGLEIWKNYPEDNPSRKKMAEQSATVAQKFRLPLEVVTAIRNHPVFIDQPQADTLPNFSDAELVIQEGSEEEVFNNLVESEEEEGGIPGTAPETENMAGMILTEALKIARYLQYTSRKIESQEHFAEELVYIVAYNAARGYFHHDLINPLLKRFKAYEENARRLQRIADVERMCIHPPSAWAYPKPRASQILCQNRVIDCPKIDQGWDIHVVSKQEAIGWIGQSLKPGNYSKCKLEEHLEDI